MKYEDYVRKMCGDDWRTVNHEETDGGFGVACMISYMRGIKPTLAELSKHLEVTPDDIKAPYIRLLTNGAFNRERWNAKKDPDLLGDNGDIAAERAWSFVAAVASGFLGIYVNI